VLCALLPVSGAWITIPLAISVAALLLSRFGRPFSIGWPTLWPLYVFYVLHIVGMAWSTDIAFGMFDLQIKSGLVLLPLAAAIFARVQGDGALRQSMVAFAAGTSFAIVLSGIKALECYGVKGWIECFTQSYLSFDLHPSYAAWYAVWALVFWAFALLNGEIPPRWRWAVIGFLLLAMVFSVMLASKSGLMCLGAMVLVFVVSVVRKLTGLLRWKVLGALALLILVPSYLLAPVISVRTGSAIRSVERLLNGTADIYASDNGNDERLVAWMCSTELIRHDAIGAGTGDIKHALVACYEAKGAFSASERQLNSHSQFLQGGVALGWAGFVVSLLVAAIPAWMAFRRRDLLLGAFMVLYVLNAAIESVLEVQAGVVFFALFLGSLAARHRSSPA